MKQLRLALIMVFLCLCMVACGPISLETSLTHPISTGPASLLAVLKSDKQRDSSPAVTTGEQQALADGNSAFAWELYQQLVKGDSGNVFYSPYSLSLALAMAYAGARGDTATQMAGTMHYTLSPDKLAEAFNYVALELAKRALAKDLAGKDGHGFRLNVVDDAWGQKDYAFLQAYLDILAENYGAGLRLMDFTKDPEGSRQTINQYISDMTEGRIKDLIPPGNITDLTRLILTNAIYFNAAWASPFNAQSTQDGAFYLLDSPAVTIPMMKQTENLKYYSGNGYQAVELPYVGGQMAMDIMVPDSGNFAVFEKSLDTRLVQDTTAKLAPTLVNFAMPRFEYDSQFSLRQALIAMGMPVVFSGGADFSGMTGKKDLFIGDVIHKAFVSVDENGTEAAAASAVIMVGAAPAKPVALTVDRPFIFFIRDIPTGAILFAGRVLSPAP